MENQAIKYFVGVDGSEASETCYHFALKDLIKQNDALIVGHISDSRKEAYLPYNYNSDYLEELFEAKIMGLKQINAKFARKELFPFKSTQECLWDLAEQEKADVIIVGDYGRKGPKIDEVVAGTTIQYLSLNTKTPTLVLKEHKPRGDKEGESLRYGICFDSSSSSKKAV